MILDQIVDRKRKELEELKRRCPLAELKEAAEGAGLPVRDFTAPLKEEGINIIAEIKKASPSKGIIREDFDPVEIARSYEAAGAKALSVLTESHYFLGSPSYIGMIKERVGLPLLRKDFILEEYQIYESRVLGADCVLLIVRILPPELLERLVALARRLGMAALVEVHTEEELKVALDTETTLIGINNRDLDTFRTDIAVTLELISHIPEGFVVVSESGIDSPADIARLKAAGVDAFLIGEALMRAEDTGAKLKELIT